MKVNFLKIICFLVLTTMYCCSNDSDSIVNENEISEVKLDKISELNSLSEQKLAYSLLNEDEKLFLWKSKFESIISDKEVFGVKVNLTQSELDFILKIKNNLSSELYVDGDNDNKEYFKNISVPEYITTANTIFKDKYLIGIIFYELFAPPGFNSKAINLNLDDLKKAFGDETDAETFSAGKPNCNCAVDSFFSCEWGQHSKKCKVDEQGDSCKVVTDCGFNWMFDCDGLCNPLITHN